MYDEDDSTFYWEKSVGGYRVPIYTFLNHTFEIIEEQQDIDIANIQNLREMTYEEFKKELEFPCITPKEVLLAKINEIIINQNTVIKAVKQLDRREER